MPKTFLGYPVKVKYREMTVAQNTIESVLSKFENGLKKHYDYPRVKIINGFWDEQCKKCKGKYIAVSVNPYHKFAIEEKPLPKKFMGYPVRIEYSQPYIAL